MPEETTYGEPEIEIQTLKETKRSQRSFCDHVFAFDNMSFLTSHKMMKMIFRIFDSKSFVKKKVGKKVKNICENRSFFFCRRNCNLEEGISLGPKN